MYEGNSEDESRKILIDGRDAETRGKRDAPTREIEGTRGTRVRAASLGKGKKSRRRMDYRGASKDGTMEAKTETSLTGSRLPGRESTWPTGALELPGSSVSTCLPLPSILLSLFLSFSRFLLLFLPSRLLLSISSSSSFSFSFSTSPLSLLPLLASLPTSEEARRGALATTFILGPYHTDTRGESFHANSPRTPSSWRASRRRDAAELVSPLKP